VWQEITDPIIFMENPQRGHSVTIIGAINIENLSFSYIVVDKTNT
jgi:hypothetical protein